MHDDSCLLCGKPSEHGHHVTGRGPDHSQLDEDFTAPLCKEDHGIVHDDLRVDEIDDPLEATTTPERIERRLLRVALFLSRLSEASPALSWIAAAARSVMSWADELRKFIDLMDERCPGWRTS